MSEGAVEVKKPAREASSTHHVIVKLETVHVPFPDIDTGDMTHELIGYEHTRLSEAAARAWPASVLITTTLPINKHTLGEAPYLRCIISETTGTDHIDLEECRRRSITVAYSPSACVEAVSEHALGLYFSARRRFVKLHSTMMSPEDACINPWRSRGSMAPFLFDSQGRAPRTCGNEVVGVVGYGPIGQRIAKLCRALGMKVLVAARKEADDAAAPAQIAGDAMVRTPFEQVLRQATVVFIAVPLTPLTRNLMAGRELALMRPDAVIINVGRGGIVDEVALLAALRRGAIAGAATDVFEVEPAGSAADSVLLGEAARGVNLTLTPHLAWYADQTKVNLGRVVAENIARFARGEQGVHVLLDMR